MLLTPNKKNRSRCRPRSHYAELKKFENGVLTVKMHQMFSVHTTPEKSESPTISGHFEFVFEKNLDRKIMGLS